MSLVTLLEAQNHLREWDEEFEAEITLKASMATDIVTDYANQSDPDWTEETAPPLIKAAVLLVLRVLYDDSDAHPLNEGVKMILHRYRDPALA